MLRNTVGQAAAQVSNLSLNIQSFPDPAMRMLFKIPDSGA
jgi:hypothetical protein